MLEINNQLVKEGPIIKFEPEDLQDVLNPHDALVISDTLANDRVKRIFVDSESFAYIFVRLCW